MPNTPRGKRNGKTIICHKAHTDKSLTQLKNEPTVMTSLTRHKIHMRSHAWKEDEVDAIPLGWLMGSLPDNVDTVRHSEFLSNDATSKGIKMPTSKVRIVFTTPSFKDNNYRHSTKAYEIQTLRPNAKAIDLCMKQHTIVMEQSEKQQMHVKH